MNHRPQAPPDGWGIRWKVGLILLLVLLNLRTVRPCSGSKGVAGEGVTSFLPTLNA